MKTLRLINFDNFGAIQEAFNQVATLKDIELHGQNWIDTIALHESSRAS